MTGTLINAGAVVLGSIVGMVFHSRLPKRLTTTVFQGIGLFTVFLGVAMALKTENYIVMIFSIVIGAVIGELLGLETGLERFSESLKKRLKSDNAKFSEGLITAFLLFCMGSMTILGAFEEGLGEEPNLLLAKSVLDGFAAMALSAGLGAGVLFSVVPLLIYQGGLTLLAGALKDFFSRVIVDELTAVGGILLIGLGFSILEIKKIKILNMLPAIVVVVVLAYFFAS